MALWDSVKRQLRSVIEWKNPAPEHLIARWTDNGDELKNASKLIVGPGQGVIFVYQGKIQAVHTTPGLYDLATANIPFLTTLTKFMQAFQSEHKVGVYFFRTSVITDQKWGTTTPIKYDDPKYKFPVGLKAFGNFSFAISNVEAFFSQVSGQADLVTTEAVRNTFLSRIMTPIKDYLAERKYSYAEIDSNLVEIAQGVKALTAHEFATLGYELHDFRISGTSFDEKTQERIDKIADMSAEAQAAAAAGLTYAQMQQLGALRDAAKNEGGAAGLGVGIGAGVGLGQQLAGVMAGGATPAPAASPAPAATGNNAGGQGGAEDAGAKLKKLKSLLEAGLITQADFDQKKAEILASL